MSRGRGEGDTKKGSLGQPWGIDFFGLGALAFFALQGTYCIATPVSNSKAPQYRK